MHRVKAVFAVQGKRRLAVFTKLPVEMKKMLANLSLSPRQRQIAAKCMLLAVDFEIEEYPNGNVLILRESNACLRIVHTGKVSSVQISGRLEDRTDEDDGAKDGTISLTSEGLKSLIAVLKQFTDVAAFDKEGVAGIERFAADAVMREDEKVLSFADTQRLLAQQAQRAAARPEAFRHGGGQPHQQHQPKSSSSWKGGKYHHKQGKSHPKSKEAPPVQPKTEAPPTKSDSEGPKNQEPPPAPPKP